MLCPECGTSVGGDSVRRCAECEARAEQRAQQRQQEIAALDPKSRRKIERADARAASPEYINDECDPELQLMAFFSSPIGISLISITVFMICLVVMVVTVPGHGVVGSALLTLMISGVAVSAAGPYAFGFSSRVKRYFARAVGVGITLLGGLLYSGYTGKSLSESYAVISNILDGDSDDSNSSLYSDSDYAEDDSTDYSADE